MNLAEQSNQETCKGQPELRQVLERMSAVLEELRQASANAQSAGSALDFATDAEAVINAQAIDRVTQTLECLSKFSAELSQISSIGDVRVSEDCYATIKLDSVRAALKADAGTSEQSGACDITLFDD